MGIGANIRQLRRRERLTQAQLASMLGVTKETVCRWERDRTLIRRESLEQLMRLFNVTSDDILSEHIGIAAQELFQGNREPVMPADADSPASPIPVYRIVRAPGRASVRTESWAYAPPDVTKRHPKSIFFKVEGQEISRTAPQDSLVLVDPGIKPWNGSIVVALVDNARVVFRRFSRGNSMVLLSTHSHDDSSPDLVLDSRRIRIMGVIVWFQASHDLMG